MIRRYDIVNGDSTTAGGTVEVADGRDILGNREQAYEDDLVRCPACHSTGRIVCVGPRLSMTGPDGREAALSDDLCVCRCDPSPRLIPSQNISYMDI